MLADDFEDKAHFGDCSKDYLRYFAGKRRISSVFWMQLVLQVGVYSWQQRCLWSGMLHKAGGESVVFLNAEMRCTDCIKLDSIINVKTDKYIEIFQEKSKYVGVILLRY